MRAAVIDDLRPCRAEVRACLCRYLEEHYAGETPQVEEFDSGEAFLQRFSPGDFDIIFIDQYMTGLSGLDTARKLRERDPLAALVFVTTSRDHAVDSFGVRACGYLVKPFGYGDFARTMELCGVERLRNARSIRVEREDVLLRELLWCDRDAHYVRLHTDRRGTLRRRCSFAELTALLAPYPQFLTCYKGCIVNLERVERMEEADFLMDGGDRVPFSRRERKTLESQYHAWLFRREREDALL